MQTFLLDFDAGLGYNTNLECYSYIHQRTEDFKC